jgi:hypothetical protein
MLLINSSPPYTYTWHTGIDSPTLTGSPVPCCVLLSSAVLLLLPPG